MKILNDFGYFSIADFRQSLIRIDVWERLAVISLGFTFISNLIGLRGITALLLLILLITELATGILAAKSRCEKIHSKPLQRFALKILCYGVLLSTFWQLSIDYKASFETYIYSQIHSFLLMYIIGVYAVSVVENIACICKERDKLKPLIKELGKKFKVKK